MPVDADGNRADIVMDALSTVSRMNLARLYEQYINSASRDVVKKIIKDLGVIRHEKGLVTKLTNIELNNPDLFNKAWSYLIGYYGILSPKMYVWFTDGEYSMASTSHTCSSRVEHLFSIINSGGKDIRGLFLYMPPDNDVELSLAIKEIERFYRPTYGPVTYVGSSGRTVTTKNPVRIGSVYVIELEKTGDDWAAVSSGKLQHFGVLSQVTSIDKFSQPSRNQPIRALGESEVRIYVSYAGMRVTADLLDRNNNPATHRQMLKSILSAAKPTNIPTTVNRSIIPLGGAKPLTLVKHICECGGFEFIYKPHVTTYGPRPV